MDNITSLHSLQTALDSHSSRIRFQCLPYSMLPKTLTSTLSEILNSIPTSSRICSLCSSKSVSKLFPLFSIIPESSSISLKDCTPLCQTCFDLHQPSTVLSAFSSSNHSENIYAPLLTQWVATTKSSLDNILTLFEAANAAYCLQSICKTEFKSKLTLVDQLSITINSRWDGLHFSELMKNKFVQKVEEEAAVDSDKEDATHEKKKKRKRRR
ncbi:hypothetical protein RCL1_004140 [Eukaryota sp. TZLM3-RCL]